MHLRFSILALFAIGACGGRSALAIPDVRPGEEVSDSSADDGASTPIIPVLDGDGGETDATTPDECNPVQPHVSDSAHRACAANQRCDVIVPGLTTTACSSPAGPGVQDEQCATNVDCAGGYDCVDVGMTQRCERYCRHGQGFDDCGSAYVCTPFIAPEYDGDQELGACE